VLLSTTSIPDASVSCPSSSDRVDSESAKFELLLEELLSSSKLVSDSDDIQLISIISSDTSKAVSRVCNLIPQLLQGS